MRSDSTDYKNTQLLLLLCNDTFTEDQKALAREMAPAIKDWEAFSGLAIENGIAAIVSVNIEECGITESVPQKVLDKLEALRNKTLARVAFISAAATDMTKLLEANGIKMLLLKGLALEYTVYGGRGLRQMNDADVLIAPDHTVVAWHLLQREGFISRPIKSPLYKRIIMCIGNHLPELHRNGISVDIHHRLFQKQGQALTQKGIDEAQEIDISGTTCFVLPPRIAFLAMIKHIQKHGIKGEFQVRLYLDLFLMLKYKSEEILCNDLLSEAEEACVSEDLSATLYLLSTHWDIDIPEKYFTALSEPDKKRNSSAFMKGLNNPGKIDPERNRDIYEYNLRSVEGTVNKLIFLVGDIFPSVSFMKERYNKNSLVAILPYYLLRTGKVFWFLRALIK